MSLEQWFRVSGYLALALSCAALVFAEAPFLPNLQFCLIPVLALLVVAWWVEGRWQLPNWGANLLGVFIAAAGLAWLAEQLADNDSLLKRIPLHLALLPYMGPLLMASLLVKVFGARAASDFWRLQGLGLMQIGLGCVLDGGPVFGGLMVAYLAVALTCLALRYRQLTDRYTERGRLASAPLPARAVFAFMLRWTLLIVLPTLLLFLFMPRRDNAAWEPLNNLRAGLRSSRIRVQAGGDEINLNEVGRLEFDDEPAFQVTAADAAGQPKLDLSLDQRWRGPVLDWYENGKWRAMHPLPQRAPVVQSELPNFGPQQYFLTLTVPPRQPGALVLAEPVCLGPPPNRLPVEILSGTRRPRVFYELTGSVVPQSVSPRRELRYRQVIPAGDDSSRLTPERVQPTTYTSNLAHLPTSLQSSVAPWTIKLLQRLSKQPRYRLPERVRAALTEAAKDFMLDPDDSEAVARALTEYLAASGEFTYTLDLTRQDRSIDPILDFLFNVKQGHCERYATALALMLRSVGIPARVVKGFRGCESLGDGHYIVRHRNAHAWVEILVPRRSSEEATARAAGRPVLEWLELDPTPADSFAFASEFSLTYFWEEIQRLGQRAWQTLIVDYNADEQANLWDLFQSSSRISTLLQLGLALPLIAALFCAAIFFRQLLRSRRVNNGGFSNAPAFYQRLLHILSSYASLRPSFGQTPREYGETVRSLLQTHPELVVLAELPLHVIDLFYRVRFGGQSLSEDERQAIDLELDHFAEALRMQNAECRMQNAE